eukprot:TRINITY_DN102105_c0_g1_i1.p1 TRINITY_DN102105_c0_g1~~TRINITY_DN102105_c0_g1_i1.p1  ORF type:complete len:230 (-),score=50.71 TRINITY_DN102105_c0_g1_i1:131-820(-)
MADTVAETVDKEDEVEAPAGKMTRTQLIGQLAERAELNRKQCGAVLDALGDIVAERLQSQGEFKLHGICRLVQSEKPARPACEKKCFGKMIQVKEQPARSKLKAYPAIALKNSLSKKGESDTKASPKKRARQERPKAERPKAKAKAARKRPAAEKDGVEDSGEAAVPEPAADTEFKIVKSLQLGLNLQVGETYTFETLKDRCKGKAPKIAKLTQMTSDPAFLERVGSAA